MGELIYLDDYRKFLKASTRKGPQYENLPPWLYYKQTAKTSKKKGK